MAEVITRFKLETTQYDSKLRDAANGLKELTHQASIAGSEFGKFTQKNVDAARAFGNIATSATNSKDKVKELVGAFNQVARSYNALTKEQQQSDFGKALAESMQTLKGRIKEAKEEMNSTGGILGQLKDKFTVNIDALKLFNVGLQGAKAALDVAKDAIFSNEQNLDEWGRIVESSESLYKGFLDALNTGDISGYLNNIDKITKAARDAYNALDELNTFNAFNQINVEKTRTGMTESIVDFREGNASKETVKAAGEAYKKELEERRKLEKEAYLKKIAEVAAQRGVSADDLTKALSGSYGSYQSLKSLPLSGTKTVIYGGGMFGGGGSYQQAVPGSVQEKLGDALRRLNDDELKNLQALGAQAERTGNEIAQVDRQLIRVLNGKTGSGGGGGGGRTGGTEITYAADSITAMEKEVSELTKLWKDASAAVRDEYAAQLDEAKLRLDSIIGKNKSIIFDSEQAAKQLEVYMGKNTAQTSGLGNIMSTFDIGSGLSTDQLKSVNGWMQELVKTANLQKLAFNAAGQAAVNFGAALSGLEDPAAKAAGTVIQAIANIVLGFSSAAAQASSMGPYGWIAYLAAGLAATATTISTIHSLTGYAEGGMVGADGRSGGMISGNTYSSDQIPIMANAGEIILNRAQQSTLAASLQGVGGNLNLHGVLTGENIFVAADRYAQRSGKGEIVTWK